LESKYFSLIDIVPAIFWAIVILFIGFLIKSSKNHLPQYRFYMLNIMMKMFFGVAFGLVYMFIYGGGDTTAYYDGAVVLNNLFFKSPGLYFEQLFSEPTRFQFTTFFDSSTGFPPIWIYKEPEAFFVSKIMSIFSFFTLKSYFAITIALSAFTAHASWKLFTLVHSYNFSSDKLISVGVLFLPSVNFWCSGISKDTIVFIGTIYFIYHSFIIISKSHKSSVKNYLLLIFMGFIIYQIRSFMLFAIIVPLIFALSVRIIKFMGGGNRAVILFRTFILIALITLGGLFSNLSTNDLLTQNNSIKQAAVIQKDFQNNENYGTKKYDLGDVQFTALGILKIVPLATVTGIYRPFIWESLSPTLILNGLESTLLFYFTFLLISRNFFKKWHLIRSNEFLIFCLVFVITIGFITGMTSILYGVLVRLRAPLLPFLCILLTLTITTSKK